MCDSFATHTDVAGADQIITRRDTMLLAFTRRAITAATVMATADMGMGMDMDTAVGDKIEGGLDALLFFTSDLILRRTTAPRRHVTTTAMRLRTKKTGEIRRSFAWSKCFILRELTAYH